MARRTPSGSRRRWAPGRAALQVKSFFDTERAETDQEADRYQRTGSIVLKLGPCARELLPAWHERVYAPFAGCTLPRARDRSCQMFNVGTVVAFGVSISSIYCDSS